MFFLGGGWIRVLGFKAFCRGMLAVVGPWVILSAVTIPTTVAYVRSPITQKKIAQEPPNPKP